MWAARMLATAKWFPGVQPCRLTSNQQDSLISDVALVAVCVFPTHDVGTGYPVITNPCTHRGAWRCLQVCHSVRNTWPPLKFILWGGRVEERGPGLWLCMRLLRVMGWFFCDVSCRIVSWPKAGFLCGNGALPKMVLCRHLKRMQRTLLVERAEVRARRLLGLSNAYLNGVRRLRALGAGPAAV